VLVSAEDHGKFRPQVELRHRDFVGMDCTTDHQDLCRLLEQLTPGLLPRDVFHAIARLMVTTTFVVVPLLHRQGQTHVLLHQRGSDDLYYPSMLDTPGTVIRATDEDLTSVYDRLLRAELPDVSVKQGPVFVGNVYDLIMRGREVSLIHWVELDEEAGLDNLFDVERLPADVVPTDRARIAMAANHFRSQLQLG
jgi:hypothetical protein